jgi:CheY-like chemotaxis protein
MGLEERKLTMTEKIAVLVVEDEPLTRIDVVDQLEESGFEVFQAPNADTAIKLLEANPAIRVLFTDIDMPGSMDGLKLAAAVRDRWPPIRIVITSGLRKIDIGALPQEARFFSKPYNVTEVASTMRAMVQN